MPMLRVDICKEENALAFSQFFANSYPQVGQQNVLPTKWYCLWSVNNLKLHPLIN